MENNTMASTYKAFLEECTTKEEWNTLIDLALQDCFSAGNSFYADLWLYFHDGSDCDVKYNVFEEV